MSNEEQTAQRASSSPLTKQFSSWVKGIGYELEFWSTFLGNRGGEWPEDFNRRMDPDCPFEDWILEGMEINQSRPLKVLDVGAGPLTVLGRRHNRATFDITAVDPLAPFYTEIADRFSIERPLETTQAFAEDLTSYFELSSFDLVHCCNALDHSFDPIRGIEEMLAVTSIGGRLVLRHNLNEGEAEGYQGFHQWNFDVKDSRFVIWNKQEKIDVAERIADYATIAILRSDSYCVVMMNKTCEVPFDRLSRSRARVKDIYSAVLQALVNGSKEPN